MSATCPRTHDVDRHFLRGLSPGRELAFRTHLRTCAPCGERYRRHLALARLDPRMPTAKERMGRGLGLLPRAPSKGPWAGALLAVAVASLVVWVQPWRSSPADFRPRGPVLAPAPVELRGWRVPTGRAPERLGEWLSPQDDLALAYVNRQGYPWLMVFAVDERRNVYWYYPTWSRAEEDPGAIPAASGDSVHELPQAIRHDFVGARLTLYGAFMDSRRSVRQLEQLVQAAPDPQALAIPGAQLVSRSLEVRR
jgi:hypothetical protein